MISNRPELLQKHVIDNSDELKFYMRDLKQWETEIKANDKKLMAAGQSKEDDLLSPVRNNPPKIPDENDEKCTTESKGKTIENEVSKNSKNCKTIESREHKDLTDDYPNELQLKQQAILEKDKGNNFLKIGNFDEAIRCYTRGLELDPYNSLLPANRALAFLKKEQFAAAEEDCDLAISMDPNYVKVYQRRATARLALLKFEEAMADFLQVLLLEPNNKEAKNQLTKIEKILTENKLKAAASVNSVDILPIHKQPHLRSKVPLRRIEVLDIASQSKTVSQSTVPVVQNAELAEKRVPDLPKPPQTSYEFQTELRRLKSYPELIYKYIKEIPCQRYVHFFQHSLESDSLSQMFNTFHDYYMWNNDDMYKPLFNLSRTKRFNMLKMFFSENDKRVLREMFDHMIQTHASSADQLESLKQYYEI